MSIASLDHVNIRTRDVAATIAFYRDVLGMTPSNPAGMTDAPFPGWILDDAGRPIVHIGDADGHYPSDDAMPFAPQSGGGTIHHVALNCTDYEGMRARLDRHGIQISENLVPQVRLRQLFCHDPNGIMLELNFREE
jgi:catechol 2,3-dioxygenase-like lactoylglutathione lyase family enzyme